MDTLTRRDIILTIILLVVILGTFTLLISDIAVPSWLIGTIGTLTTGIIGVNIGNGDNGN